MDSIPVSDELWVVGELALNYAFELLEKHPKEPFQPAILTQLTSGKIGLHQLLFIHTSDDPEAFARKVLADLPDVARAAIVLDGYLHIDGEPQDAILMRLGEVGGSSYDIGQRYRRKRLGKRVDAVGNVAFMGEIPSIFA
jgi:hypothetical protein